MLQHLKPLWGRAVDQKELYQCLSAFSSSYTDIEIDCKSVVDLDTDEYAKARLVHFTHYYKHNAILGDVCSQVKSHGALGVSVSTDLTTDYMMDSLLRCNVDVYLIEIDAVSPQTYQTIHGGDLNSLLVRVSELFTKTDGIVIPTFKKLPENRNEIFEFMKFWQQRNVLPLLL